MYLNKFEQFLLNRQILIKHYNKGDLSKSEFIEMNYNAVQSLDIKPFQKIDNVKKGIYNYQYYNVLAKYYQKKAHDLPKNHPAREDYFSTSEGYYEKKDHSTLKLLRFLDFRDVEAYFVRVNSPNLKRKLIEIVINDYDHLILHTTSEVILNSLIRENVFSNETRDSVVDNYINKKYWFL